MNVGADKKVFEGGKQRTRRKRVKGEEKHGATRGKLEISSKQRKRKKGQTREKVYGWGGRGT